MWKLQEGDWVRNGCDPDEGRSNREKPCGRMLLKYCQGEPKTDGCRGRRTTRRKVVSSFLVCLFLLNQLSGWRIRFRGMGKSEGRLLQGGTQDSSCLPSHDYNECEVCDCTLWRKEILFLRVSCAGNELGQEPCSLQMVNRWNVKEELLGEDYPPVAFSGALPSKDISHFP